MNPEITILYQFHAQKALFKVPKICNINFWIENEPPPSPFGTFPKIHPIPDEVSETIPKNVLVLGLGGTGLVCGDIGWYLVVLGHSRVVW